MMLQLFVAIEFLLMGGVSKQTCLVFHLSRGPLVYIDDVRQPVSNSKAFFCHFLSTPARELKPTE